MPYRSGSAGSRSSLTTYSHPILQEEEKGESSQSCRDQLKGTAVILFSPLADGLASALKLNQQWKEGRNGESAAAHSHRLPASPPQCRIRGLNEHTKDLARHHAKLFNQKIAS